MFDKGSSRREDEGIRVRRGTPREGERDKGRKEAVTMGRMEASGLGPGLKGNVVSVHMPLRQ